MSLLGVEIVGTIGGRPGRRIWNVTGVSIDSRAINGGEIFFALEGTRTDGHKYVRQALEKGAAVAVVHRKPHLPEALQERVVRVPDTLQALGDSARRHRRNWGGIVIAVTGSNGKTTTRAMIHHILSGVMQCKQSPKNFNTNIGVPLTLFETRATDKAVVVEMGANAPGEIRELAAIAEPNMAVITNIGKSHLEGLGYQEGVAQAKAELLQGLDESGVAFLNADDPWFSFLAGHYKGSVVSFGLGRRAEIRARAVRRIEGGHWFLAGAGIDVHLLVPGVHNVCNAVAALAVARHLKVDLGVAASRLKSFRLPPMRFHVEKLNGLTVIVDCYNANPDSVRAALETFQEMPATGRRIAVLGDMLELGPESEALHQELGACMLRFQVDAVWGIGARGECLAHAAEANGLAGAAFHAPTIEAAATEICEALGPGDAVLLKGSRGMEMEKLVDRFRKFAPVAARR